MKQIYNEYQRIIGDLIKLNKMIRQNYRQDAAKSLSRATFAKEFATVNINIGRRTGNTEYVKIFADENDAVLVPSKKVAARVYPDEYDFDIIVLREWTQCYYEYDHIFVELTNFFGEINIERMYETFAKNPYQTFIFLGRN